MIFKGSRYQGVGVYTVTRPDGQSVPAFGIRFIPPTPAGFFHTFSGDQRLDLIANQYYRNPEKFWLIADANTAMDPEDLLEPGRQLLIPPDRT
jgi:nucleoid-associated protein YgaU